MSLKPFLKALPALFAVPFLLTACASGGGIPEPGTVGPNNELYAKFSVSEAPYGDGILGGEIFPYVTDVHADGFTLVNGGSSSCPNIIETVILDGEFNKIDIIYKKYGDRPCTDDFRLTASEVFLIDLELHEFSSTVFYLDGSPVEVLSSPLN